MGETLEGGICLLGSSHPPMGESHTCSCESHLGSHKVIRDLPLFDNSKNGRGKRILTLYRATKGKPSPLAGRMLTLLAQAFDFQNKWEGELAGT